MSAQSCVFCAIEPERIVAQNRLAFAIRDAYPVSPGHTLIIPRAHVQDWWAASDEDRAAIDRLLLESRAALDAELRPNGYNVGINNGAAAGQTVFHLHVHLIPRYDRDVPDPTGGVRHVIPGRGNYRRASDVTSPGEGAALRTGAADLMQRVLGILDEGRRSATYKPALMLALTELAAERSEGTLPLRLPLMDVAERVMEMYWPQTRPHPAAPDAVLRQSLTARLRVPDALARLRAKAGASPSAPLERIRASHPRDYETARRTTTSALAREPVPRLQRPGSSHGVEAYPRFLYDDSRYVPGAGALDREPVIILAEGVAETLARNVALIRIAAQDIWVQDVARFSGLRLDQNALHEFLFGAVRSSLRVVAEGLRDSGSSACFWCGRALAREVEVDHVIPWSHYAHDDLFNLVLTDPACNNDKRDRLVSDDLIDRWLRRDHEVMAEVARAIRWPMDPARSRAVARASYRYLANGMPVWRGKRDLVLFDSRQRARVLRRLDQESAA